MRFDLTRWGGRFPNLPYFPMYLANGVDATLINIMGVGDYNGEWMDDDMGVPYSYMRSVGWFKCDRRTYTDTALVYGKMFPLLEFSTATLLNRDEMIPRNCRQYFDPRKAILTTFIEQLDHDTEEWIRTRVTAFMTSDHVLVEHHEILDAPHCGTGFTFYVSSPLHPYIDLYKPAVTLDRTKIAMKKALSLTTYEFAFEEFKGGAYSWFDKPAADCSTTGDKRAKTSIGKMTSVTLKKGQSITRYLAVIDNEDAPDFREALRKTCAEYRKLGYAGARRRHDAEWAEFFGTSDVELPDKAMQHVYDISRYMMRANHNPVNGFQAVGLFPYLWQGVMFWDSWFMLDAMLSCGNLTEANRIISHLINMLPKARLLAKKLNSKGARLEWTITTRDFTNYPAPCRQFHNNADWAHAAFLCYESTGSIEILKKHVLLMEEYLLFMVDYCLKDMGDHMIVGECLGIDESVTNKKINDTWTVAITLKALLDYRKAVSILGRRSAIRNLDAIIGKVRAGFEKNVDKNGVLQSFRGGRIPHWGSLVFQLFPEHRSLIKTLQRLEKNYDPELDIFNFHGLNRYAEKGFPWAQYWAARLYALAGNERAGFHLRHALKDGNYFGGIPERVYYHREMYNNWTPTAHAAMILAVNTVLVHASENSIRILNGAEKTWRNLQFENIHAGHGFAVSAVIRNRKFAKLRIRNLNSDAREADIFLAGKKFATVELKPGLNRI